MSLEEARATRWVFKKELLKEQPIGELLDKGLIDQKDLLFASQPNKYGKVKDAAIVILRHMLDQSEKAPQPEKPFEPLHVISSGLRSFSEYKQLEVMLWQGFVFGISLGFLLAIMAYYFFQSLTAQTPETSASSTNTLTIIVAGIILFILIIIGFAIFLGIPVLISNYLDKQLKLYRKGQKGEENARDIFYRVLDGEWYLFRNLELPGRRGDLDMVLVGLKGVWLIEVKTWDGAYRNIGDLWEYKGQKFLPKTRKNPTKQAQKNARTLRDILNKEGVNWVQPAIIWANPNSKITAESPTVPIWAFDNLAENLRNLSSKQTLSEEQRTKIVAVLEKFTKAKAANLEETLDE